MGIGRTALPLNWQNRQHFRSIQTTCSEPSNMHHIGVLGGYRVVVPHTWVLGHVGGKVWLPSISPLPPRQEENRKVRNNDFTHFDLTFNPSQPEQRSNHHQKILNKKKEIKKH